MIITILVERLGVGWGQLGFLYNRSFMRRMIITFTWGRAGQLSNGSLLYLVYDDDDDDHDHDHDHDHDNDDDDDETDFD